MPVHFKIGFDPRDKVLLHSYWDEIIANQRWSEGKFVSQFEDKWKAYNGTSYAIATNSWTGATLSVLEYLNIRGKVVLCPSNTFMATPMSVIKAGGNVEFVDCNRNDLCMNLEDLEQKIDQFKPAAVWLVHIGGHIAFQVNEIATLCHEYNVPLIEDCAHAHGASWHGRRAGSWGIAGIYSFYATKTISTGEGGMLVTNDDRLAEFARKYRNYGKSEYEVAGLNYRMNEFTAAIGCVQVDRLYEIVNWKNKYARTVLDPQYPNRVILPDDMISGYYKYIVFDPIEKSTGKVYDQPCHRIMGHDVELPNTEWVASNHWCVPIYYRGDE
jgi:dTDP-4-amino-4,6-dideoxygalactose transaminase